MMEAVERLTALVDDRQMHERPRSELEPLWLQAANERLADHRKRIPVLGTLADDLGIDEIRTFEDLIPLLFAHSTYKSYPESLVQKGRWELMNKWLDTLSAERVEGVDTSGIGDQDQWVDRLRDAGHIVFVSSGTTGKNSFLPATPADSAFSLRALIGSIVATTPLSPDQSHAVFILGPKYGPHRAALHFRTIAETFGRPNARFFLTEEAMRATDMSRMAELRKKIAAGTAKPSEIAAAEEESTTRQREMNERLDALIDELISRRGEPMFIGGFWAQYWTIVERARARGVKAGEFHPDTIVTGGGGTKGAVMPDDYEQQILEFFGIPPENIMHGYGMSELSAACSGYAGRYRPAPWVIPLLLDDSGEKLRDVAGGEVTGRFGFLDIAIDGRWGGVITGDRITVDPMTPNFSVVPGTIERYSATAGGDDKLTCAGTVDAYVRGAVSS